MPMEAWVDKSVICDFCQQTVFTSDLVGRDVGRCDRCREYCSKCGCYLEEAGRSGLCDSCLDDEENDSE